MSEIDPSLPPPGSSDARLEELLAVIPDIVVTLSPDGRLLSCNAASTALLGYAPHELVGRRLPDLPTLDADGLAVADRELRNRFEGGVTGPVLVPMRHRDGSRRWFEVRSGIGRERDGGTVLWAVLRDTTERLRAEQRLRAIVDATHDLIFIVDPEGLIRFENAAVSQTLGSVPGGRVGRNILSAVHPDDLSMARDRLARLQAAGATTSLTVRMRHENGSWRHFETHGHNMMHVPAIGGILGVGRDVTDRMRLQERLEAVERLDSIGRLAGGIAHDFNNLLAVILASAEDLRPMPADRREAEHGVSLIIGAAERARELTSKLLTFARRQPSQPGAVVDVVAAVRAAESLLRRLLGAGCTLDIETTARRAMVGISAAQLEQVLLNLAANSRDAMPEGGSLRIVVEVAEGAALQAYDVALQTTGAVVRLAFRDSGTGMTQEMVAKAFEPFYSTKEHGKGTGLGLSMVYGIARAGGGDVRISSEPGRGTEVDVLLPMVSTERLPAAPPGVAAPVRGGGETVLVVEDNEDVRVLAIRTLSQVGYQVVPAASGAEALALMTATGSPVRLVVTDVIMPGMTGVTMAQEIRKQHADMPVLFITGYTPDHVLERQSLDERTALLTKPFKRDVLLQRVREMLDAASPPLLQ